MITVLDAITSRKSVRSFTKKQVSNKIIKNILEVASQAPSGTNTQPWNVHVLTGKKLKYFTSKFLAVWMNFVGLHINFVVLPVNFNVFTSKFIIFKKLFRVIF